jgi:hypothetical protein
MRLDGSDTSMTRGLLPFGLIALLMTGCYARAGASFAAGVLLGAAVTSHLHEEVVVVEAPSRAPEPAPLPPALPQPPHPPPARFDASAAHAALRSADVASCRARGVPAGAQVHVVVTFEPSGSVRSAVIDQPSGLSRDAVQCLADVITTARVPPWDGGNTSVEERYRP